MKKDILGTTVFLVMTCILFFAVQNVFGVSNSFSEHAEMMFEGYYDEQEDTVDAVIIGNSHIYRYWQSAFGWKEYGISTLALSTSDMPGSVIKNMAIEACKTQNPKLLVFDATAFADKDNVKNNKIYMMLNNMKLSKNYIDTVDNFCAYAGVTGMEKFDFYLPIIQFHSRWKEINQTDFEQTYPSYLNSCYMEEFLTSTIKERAHKATDERVKIGKRNEAVLRDLLEWCKGEDIEIQFLAVPLLRNEKKLGMINYVGDIVEEYGYEFLNYNDADLYESFDFDVSVDFQDKNHTNVNGSYKFSKVYGKYLVERYSLADHRGESEYASWDERADAYMDIIREYFIY